MSKPRILIYSNDGPNFGLPIFVKAIAGPHFKLIMKDELNRNPNLRELIEGIISYVPGWGLITRTNLCQFKRTRNKEIL